MARCCVKPIVRIIKAGEIEAGITGLDQVLEKVVASGVENDQAKRDLLRLVKENGNYIAPSRENEYAEALYREFLAYRKTTH